MNYELIYILSPKLSDEDAEKLALSFNRQIKENATEIFLEDFWGKKDLAYPINKLEQGYYMLVQFKAERKNIKEIDKKLKLEGEIIRYLIVKKDNFIPDKKEKKEDYVESKNELSNTEEATEKAAEEATEIEELNDKREIASQEKANREEIKSDTGKKEANKKKAKTSISDLDKKIDDILDSGIED